MIDMHIITVSTQGYYVSYDIEVVNEKMQIVARFTKSGELIHTVYNASGLGCSGVDMIVKLTNRDYAIHHASQIINESKKSKHSPFNK